MAFSTTPSDGNDRLRATADDQTINALGGSDWLRSTFDASTLYGGNGNDRITVTLDLPEPTEDDFSRSSALYGGDGNDWLVSDFTEATGNGTTLEFFSRQSGGLGNDNIFISAVANQGGFGWDAAFDFEVYGGSGLDDIWIEVVGRNLSNTNYVDAGSGSDVIHIFSEVGNDIGNTINEVNAGDGDDEVIVSGEPGLQGDTFESMLRGGEGNDRLEAQAGGSTAMNTL